MSEPRPSINIDDIDRAPASLPPENGRDWREEYDKLNIRFVEVAEESARLKSELEELRRRNRTREILDSLMQPYASRVYAFMCVYCLFAGAVVLLDGFSIRGFGAADSVIQIIVGSTAVTVIGLVGMVLTGIFVGARRH